MPPHSELHDVTPVRGDGGFEQDHDGTNLHQNLNVRNYVVIAA